MEHEQRRIAGGWPGTMSEARAFLVEDLIPHLTAEHRKEVEAVGREEVARQLYRGAREHWVRRAVRYDDEA
jgi:hypothetical protein